MDKKNEKINVDLIIFDFDGTIVDTKKSITQCYNHALKQKGLKLISIKNSDRYIGPSLYTGLKNHLKTNNKKLIEQLISIYRERYTRTCVKESKLYPKMKQILKYYHKKKKLAIASAKPTYFVKKIAKGLGIMHYFDIIEGSEPTDHHQDKKIAVKNVLNKMKTKKAVMIGDRDTDIIAGKKNDIYTIGVTYGIGSKKEIQESHPDKIIKNITEIQKIIS